MPEDVKIPDRPSPYFSILEQADTSLGSFPHGFVWGQQINFHGFEFKQIAYDSGHSLGAAKGPAFEYTGNATINTTVHFEAYCTKTGTDPNAIRLSGFKNDIEIATKRVVLTNQLKYLVFSFGVSGVKGDSVHLRLNGESLSSSAVVKGTPYHNRLYTN